MNRRVFLAGAGTAATVGIAGCLDAFGGSTGISDDVVLDVPELYDETRQSIDGGHLQHPPIHGDELPEAVLPDVFGGGEVSTREYVGDRHVLLTFVFTRCTMACPVMVSNMVGLAVEAREEGYGDELAYVPMTFDPEHDTPEVISDYREEMGIPETDNWHFLRPESEERADAIVSERFGVWYETLSDEDREERELPDSMAYDHLSAIVLANKDGYVERGYSGQRVPNVAGLIDDVETLRERW